MVITGVGVGSGDGACGGIAVALGVGVCEGVGIWADGAVGAGDDVAVSVGSGKDVAGATAFGVRTSSIVEVGLGVGSEVSVGGARGAGVWVAIATPTTTACVWVFGVGCCEGCVGAIEISAAFVELGCGAMLVTAWPPPMTFATGTGVDTGV